MTQNALENFIELQVVLPDTSNRGKTVDTPFGKLRYETVLVPRVQDHPADNRGAITGVCQVCDKPVAHHRAHLDKEGNVIEIKTQEKTQNE